MRREEGKRESRIVYRRSFFLRIADLFPDPPGEEVESIENDFCKPIVAEGVIFWVMIVYGNKKDEMNRSCEENNEPGERKKQGFDFPGKWIE